MFKRVVVALVCTPFIFLSIYFTPAWVLPIIIAALSAVAVFEVLHTTKFVTNRGIFIPAVIMGGLVPLWTYFGLEDVHTQIVLFVFVAILFAVAFASHYAVTLEMLAGAFFFAIIIPFFMSTFVRLRAMELWNYYILIPMVVGWLTDTCALFAGMAFGKRKLAPDLSPKKTVEGAIGGLIGATFFTLLYGWIVTTWFGAPPVHYGYLVLYAVLGSPVGQFGDLAFSYIKRQYKIKDYGTLFPGHGGVLDRFDSILFCAPLVEILIVFFPAFGGSV